MEPIYAFCTNLKCTCCMYLLDNIKIFKIYAFCTVLKLTLLSYEILSDGKYHKVELLAVKKNFTLRVDGGLARYIQDPSLILENH